METEFNMQKKLMIGKLDVALADLSKINGQYKNDYNRVKKLSNMIDGKEDNSLNNVAAQIMSVCAQKELLEKIVGPGIVIVFKDEDSLENFYLKEIPFMKDSKDEIISILKHMEYDVNVPNLVLNSLSYISRMCWCEKIDGKLELVFDQDIDLKQRDNVISYLAYLLVVIETRKEVLKDFASDCKTLLNELKTLIEKLKSGYLIDGKHGLEVLNQLKKYGLLELETVSEMMVLINVNNDLYEAQRLLKVEEERLAYERLKAAKGPRRIKKEKYSDGDNEVKKVKPIEIPDDVLTLAMAYCDVLIGIPVDELEENGLDNYFPVVQKEYQTTVKALIISLLKDEQDVVLPSDLDAAKKLGRKIKMLQDYEPSKALVCLRR